MSDQRAEFVHGSETFAILGACFEVYKNKGCGFTENVYQECLAIEFRLRGVPFTEQPLLTLSYKGHELEAMFRPDFICYDLMLVELKAVPHLIGEHRAQVHNYLKATGLRVALLV